jgi:hypothetical protein
MVETYVLTFNITNSFDDWVKSYDGSIDLQKQASVTSLFRGVDKEDPFKVCAVMQPAPGVMNAFMSSNSEMIVNSGHIIESTVASVFIG